MKPRAIHTYRLISISIFPSLVAALLGDESNSRRLTFIQELQGLCIKDSDDSEYLKKWCNKQLEVVLSSLKDPTEEDVHFFLSIAKRRGAVFLREMYVTSLHILLF